MRKVIRIIFVLLVITGIVAVLVWAATDTQDGICHRVNIETTGDFLSVSEIQSYLRKENLYPSGMPMCSISTQDIENGLAAHPMVRNVQCYKRGDTIIELYVVQRLPILRVLSDGETYYIDADRKRMPVRPDVKTDVIWVKGHVGEQMAREEIADFVLWLKDNSYWHPRIQSIEIREGKQVVLRQAQDEPPILLGRINDYEHKLHKVRVFTEKMNDYGMTVPAYKELDARFERQIVGRN